tara:strand:+ start:27 stop:248 length:222 start_codon:yes stop_codon:yes gene_type:complete
MSSPKKQKVVKGLYLVSWRNMQKGSDIPLPMRPFDSYEEAECYKLGCADVVCIASKKELDIDKVLIDFVITQQ